MNTKRAICLTLSCAILTVAAIAHASDWHVVGAEVGDGAEKNDDGTWSVWLSDGEGNHVSVTGETRKEARQAAKGAEQALEQQGCVDPCVFNPEDCSGNTSTRLQTSAADFELVAVRETPNGYQALCRNEKLQSVIITRATESAAQADGQALADGLNAGQCVAF